jgi:hypothetical protein
MHISTYKHKARRKKWTPKTKKKSERPSETNMALVTACVGGAATIKETKEMLEEAGFKNIRITPKDESREIIRACEPEVNVDDYIVSAYLGAEKPF